LNFHPSAIDDAPRGGGHLGADPITGNDDDSVGHAGCPNCLGAIQRLQMEKAKDGSQICDLQFSFCILQSLPKGLNTKVWRNKKRPGSRGAGSVGCFENRPLAVAVRHWDSEAGGGRPNGDPPAIVRLYHLVG
jgi:hypothetical protein